MSAPLGDEEAPPVRGRDRSNTPKRYEEVDESEFSPVGGLPSEAFQPRPNARVQYEPSTRSP